MISIKWLLLLLPLPQVHDVDKGPPSRECVPINCIEETLRDALKELLRLQVRLVEGLTNTKELRRRRAGHDKVLGPIDAADDVHGTNKRLVVLVQARNYGLHKVGAPALPVLRAAHEMGKGPGTDFALLPQLVQIGLEGKQLRPTEGEQRWLS